MPTAFNWWRPWPNLSPFILLDIHYSTIHSFTFSDCFPPLISVPLLPTSVLNHEAYATIYTNICHKKCVYRALFYADILVYSPIRLYHKGGISQILSVYHISIYQTKILVWSTLFQQILYIDTTLVFNYISCVTSCQRGRCTECLQAVFRQSFRFISLFMWLEYFLCTPCYGSPVTFLNILSCE